MASRKSPRDPQALQCNHVIDNFVKYPPYTIGLYFMPHVLQSAASKDRALWVIRQARVIRDADNLDLFGSLHEC